ncbi:TraR/DksA C4-type zinc finger protein [Azorhizobium sp. AG788]|uniref:TraR/DksA C4-type zinc finger protein n=1 Tax=Azorhizobium sp. AG788 TaxID=2183897 RepID=UPI00313A01C9
MDTLDSAQRIEERTRAAEIDAARAAVRRPGAEVCTGCGDPIDEARRLAAPWATRCVVCQNAVERHMRGHRCQVG